jgi:hypothetical protein
MTTTDKPTFEDLVEQIKAKAAACKNLKSADLLYINAPAGSQAERMYFTRKAQLSAPEAYSKALSCMTEEEARIQYGNVAQDGGSTAQVFWDRIVELADVEAPTKAAACETANEASVLHSYAPEGSIAEKIYETRWMELHLQGK